uniref:F5/8 type C domain-containing protein n=1 Tax=Ciona savignyi TaxID=51511 RepID=H2ZM28_CIOSA
IPYRKTVFRKFSDAYYTRESPRIESLGYFGPTLIAEVGDILVVRLRNRASVPCNLQAQGVREIAAHADRLLPNNQSTYQWEIPQESSLTYDDPPCVARLYFSSVDRLRDLNSGLVGSLIICKTGWIANVDDITIPPIVLFFSITDESTSHHPLKSHVHYNINGFSFDTFPSLSTCPGETTTLFLIGLSVRPSAISVTFENHVIQVRSYHTTNVVSLFTGSSQVVKITPQESITGRFKFSSFVNEHYTNGMTGSIEILDCSELYNDHHREKRHVRTYYIAAEEYLWDYAPTGNDLMSGESLRNSRKKSSRFYSDGRNRIGSIYMKAHYVRYTDEMFRTQFEISPIDRHLGSLGPVIRVEVGETLRIVFKNSASRSYSFHLDAFPFTDSEVLPNQRRTYQWEITEEDAPGLHKVQCVTRFYYSNTDPIRDIATGLIGPLLVCQRGALDTNGRQRNINQELFLHFSTINENLNWYINQTIPATTVGPIEELLQSTAFYQSNLMSSMNGLAYGNLIYMSSHVYDDVSLHVMCTGSEQDVHNIRIQNQVNLFYLLVKILITVSTIAGKWTISTDNQESSENGMSAFFVVHGNETSENRSNQDQRHGKWWFILIYDFCCIFILKLCQIFKTFVKALQCINKSCEFEELIFSINCQIARNTHLPTPSNKIIICFMLPVISDNFSGLTDNLNHFTSLGNNVVSIKFLKWHVLLDFQITKETFIDTTIRWYYIAAIEQSWNYIDLDSNVEHLRENNTIYKKVLYEEFIDSTFTKRKPRVDKNGLLGPVIKAEAGDTIKVVFQNQACRPYSIHPVKLHHSVNNTGTDFAHRDPIFTNRGSVFTGHTRTYTWTVPPMADIDTSVHPSECTVSYYHSNADAHKDIHSGLIGPLLICNPGILGSSGEIRYDVDREFYLLFKEFDETQSWYVEENQQFLNQWNVNGSNVRNVFHTINGLTYGGLVALETEPGERIGWHVINLDSHSHSINFEGNSILTYFGIASVLSVRPLLPGSSATLTMVPTNPGMWLIHDFAAQSFNLGMYCIYKVRPKECRKPLGLESGMIGDHQISSSSVYITKAAYGRVMSKWSARHARLNTHGHINAWMPSRSDRRPWIQVDLGSPMRITGITIQGTIDGHIRKYVTQFKVLYSVNNREWAFYSRQGSDTDMVFKGNYFFNVPVTRTFSPQLLARYIRLVPVQWQNQPAVRMELLGCSIEGRCEEAQGIGSGDLPDSAITASSEYLYKRRVLWQARFARLNYRPDVRKPFIPRNNRRQWIQADFGHIIKVAGIVTQGAIYKGWKLFVKSFYFNYSIDGFTWQVYEDPVTNRPKIFRGNIDPITAVAHTLQNPVLARYIQIQPRSWRSRIALRFEILGCSVN